MFEAFLMEFIKCMTAHQMVKFTSTNGSKLWNMNNSYTRKAREDADYSKIDKNWIDEISKKGNHNNITTFEDIQKRRIQFTTKDKDQTTLKTFVDDFKEHQGKSDQIKQVACGISWAFIKGIADNLPNAEITSNKFHVVKVSTDTIDKVRLEEVTNNPSLKSSRFLLLKNHKNLKEKQDQKLIEIRISYVTIKMLRCYDLKESFQQIIYACSLVEFKALIKMGYFVASPRRIKPMIEAVKSIKKRSKGIETWFDSRIRNSILEVFNSLFQSAKVKARNYQLDYTAISLVYLFTARLDYFKIIPHYK